jgi:GGDEF domain-containing protein
LSWLLESIAAYIALILFNVIFMRGQPAFIDAAAEGARLHPYLFVILLMACRYGTAAGVFSAIAGCLIMVVWAKPDFSVGVGENVKPATIQMLVFVLSGVVFGLLRNKYMQKEIEMQDNIEKTSGNVTDLENENEMLFQITTELERKILTDIQSFANLYTISQDLEKLNKEEICLNVPHIVAEHLDAERCSIYMHEEGELVIKGSYGWPSQHEYRDHIPLDNSMIGMAFRERRLLSIRHFLESNTEVENLGESILCAPLVDDNNHVLGVINIESMPFLRMTNDSMTIFFVLAQWVSKALVRATYVESVQAHTITDHLLETYNRPYLEERLAEEFVRVKQSYQPFTLLLMRLTKSHDQTTQARLGEVKMIISYLELLLKKTDILASYSEDVPLALLMLARSETDLTDFIEQIESDLNRLLSADQFEERLKIGVAGYAESMESWEQLVKAAEAKTKELA